MIKNGELNEDSQLWLADLINFLSIHGAGPGFKVLVVVCFQDVDFLVDPPDFELKDELPLVFILCIELFWLYDDGYMDKSLAMFYAIKKR